MRSFFRFLMQHNHEDPKLEQSCDLDDANLFRAVPASRSNWIATLSDDDLTTGGGSWQPPRTLTSMRYALCRICSNCSPIFSVNFRNQMDAGSCAACLG